ncbi:MAG: hypothetical protein IJR87_02950 [Bacteroidaceae bacterium]|nr:hypothetical protein [Bacteroidaceae bacterium]
MQKKNAFFFHSRARGPSRRRIGAHFLRKGLCVFAERPLRKIWKAFAKKIPPGGRQAIILTVSPENILAKPWPNEKETLTLQSEKEGKLLTNI